MFCPYCGKPTADGSAFCANCGSSLSAIIPPAVEPAIEEAPVVAPAAAIEPQPEPSVAEVAAPVESAPADVPAPAEEPVSVEEPSPAEEFVPLEDFLPIEEPVPVEAPAQQETVPPVQYAPPVQQYAPPVQQQYVPQQPVYYATPVAAPVAAPILRTRPKSSVVAKIFSVLLCLFLVVDVFGLLVCLSLRDSISARTIKNTLEEIDVLEFPYDGENTVLDAIAEQYEEMGEDISADDIREALDDSKAYAELKGIAADFAGYVLGDSGSELPDADSLRDLVEDLCDDLDYEMTDADLAELDVMLEDFEDAIDEFEDATMEDMPELAAAQAIVSTLVVGILGAIALLIVLLILAMNRRRYATFCYAGVSTVLAGGMCYVVGALSDMVIKTMSETDASAEYVLDAVGGMLTGSFSRIGLIGAGAGAVLIVLYIVCNTISKKKYSC